MGDYLTKGTTYADGGTVNASNLNAHVDDAVFKSTAISARTDLVSPGGATEFLVNDAGTLKKVTLTNLATAVSGGSSLIHGKTEVTTISNADEFLIWEDGVAADRRITRANLVANGMLMPTGAVLQTLQTTYSSNSSITASIPIDDTIPTSSEGTQILSQSITPVSSSNTVLVRFKGQAAVSSTGETAVAALFRGTTCLDAMAIQGHNGTAGTITFILEEFDAPATASAVTYTVRIGVSAGSVRLNGQTDGRKFGGAAQATLTVQEIKG